jgi:enoyl-CoA hydratase/carnithine racemase
MATGAAPGVRIEEGYAVVDPARAAADFGELADVLEALRDEPGMGVAVLDLRKALPGTYLENEAAVLGRCVLPLVAAWGGNVSPAALAAGLWCDVRVMANDATFATLEGLHAPTVERMVEVVAPARDPELARIDIRALVQALGEASDGHAGPGEVLLDAGLVTELASAGEGLHAAESVARMIASRGPLATQLAKEAVWRGLRMPFEQALRFETDLTLLLQTTKDRAEGVRAFVEKRPPRFRGE